MFWGWNMSDQVWEQDIEKIDSLKISAVYPKHNLCDQAAWDNSMSPQFKENCLPRCVMGPLRWLTYKEHKFDF